MKGCVQTLPLPDSQAFLHISPDDLDQEEGSNKFLAAQKALHVEFWNK